MIVREASHQELHLCPRVCLDGYTPSGFTLAKNLVA
jgi:hypothetical protein